MNLTIRAAESTDRAAIFAVERAATPGLIYLPRVFDQFAADANGPLLVAELDGRVVGCGKFTCLPDGSAWLETLRVLPECQGRGVGKAFYRRFLEIAAAKGINTLRMYTGVSNHASKGLAESFGFGVVETFRGQRLACAPGSPAEDPPGFVSVRDARLATDLLLGQRAAWGNFVVMNRTFYTLSAALAAALAQQGMVYHDPRGENLVVLGARFLPEDGLHLGLLAGDVSACLAFAQRKALEAGAAALSCLSPRWAVELHAALTGGGFALEPSDFIVMETNRARD